MLKMGKNFTFAYGQGRVGLTPSPLTVSLTVRGDFPKVLEKEVQ